MSQVITHEGDTIITLVPPRWLDPELNPPDPGGGEEVPKWGVFALCVLVDYETQPDECRCEKVDVMPYYETAGMVDTMSAAGKVPLNGQKTLLNETFTVKALSEIFGTFIAAWNLYLSKTPAQWKEDGDVECCGLAPGWYGVHINWSWDGYGMSGCWYGFPTVMGMTAEQIAQYRADPQSFRDEWGQAGEPWDQPQPFTMQVMCGPFVNGSNYDWGMTIRCSDCPEICGGDPSQEWYAECMSWCQSSCLDCDNEEVRAANLWCNLKTYAVDFETWGGWECLEGTRGPDKRHCMQFFGTPSYGGPECPGGNNCACSNYGSRRFISAVETPDCVNNCD